MGTDSRGWVFQVGTKGLHMTFNTNGIGRLASDPELEPLFKYFQKVRYLDANAWKLNLFLMDTAPGFVADEGVFGVHHGASLCHLSDSFSKDTFQIH